MAIFHLPVPSLVFERRNPNLLCRKPAFFMLLYIQIVLDSSVLLYIIATPGSSAPFYGPAPTRTCPR
jgi:hypothetical protein